MKTVDFVLHPGMLLLLAVGSFMAGAVTLQEYGSWDKQGTDGVVRSLFVFAAAALPGAVVRLGQLRDGNEPS